MGRPPVPVVRAETETRRREGVTFVEATLTHDGPDPRVVRLRSRLDGPVWPPRRRGVPAAGWDPEAGVVQVRLAPGERVGVGFASPAPPVDPPVEVASTHRADDDGRATDGGIADSAAGVVRTLGDPTPPADAVPAPSPGTPPDRDSTADDRRDDGDPSVAATDSPSGGGRRNRNGSCIDRDSDAQVVERSGVADGTDSGRAAGGYPAVAAWLAAVERRIARAETPEKRDDRPTRRRLATDAERLRAVMQRAVELAERADDLPRSESGECSTTDPEAGGRTGREMSS